MPDPEVIAAPDAAPEVEAAKPAAVPEAALPEGEQETEQQKQGGLQRKFDKLTREKYELREQLAEARGRLAAQPRAETQKPPEADDPKPDINKWTGTYEELIAAISRWEARQEYKQLSAKEREDAVKAEREERERETVETYRERMNEFVKDHDDFVEVVNSAKLPESISGPVQVAIVEDEHGPELAYYLGQHPEFCAKLADLTSAGAVKAIGRLSERLFPETTGPEDEDEDEAEIPLVTSPKPKLERLPKPITPGRKATPTDAGLSDNLPTEEWAKRFRKKMNYGD